MSLVSVYSCFGDRVFDNLRNAISSNITLSDYNGKDCYLIKINGQEMWVDKDTGLIYRNISGLSGVTEYMYEFDSVKNTDIQKPQL